MSLRVLQHTAFWLSFTALYALVYALFAAPSDMEYSPGMRYLRSYFAELVVLPCKAIPFYILFYFVLPRHQSSGRYFNLIIWFLLAIIPFVVLHRLLVPEINNLLDGENSVSNTLSFRRMLFTFGDILPAIALAGLFKLMRAKTQAQKKEELLQREKLQSELKFLKAQTNPHFLFNTLNNIYGLARKNDPRTAPSILRLSNLMRFILYECEEKAIPISQEVHVIEEFITLEQMRYDQSLNLKFDMDIDNDSQLIPPLVLLPLVENAFKHGAGESIEQPFVIIRLELKGENLKFRVSNNFQPTEKNNTNGIGLNNLRKQLSLQYPGLHTLETIAIDGVFTALLNIHLNQRS